MTTAIRKLGEDDWEMLRDIRLEALETDQAAFGSSIERERGFREMHWRMRLRGSSWWVAEVDGTPAGLVCGMNEPGATEDDRHVVALWVRPSERSNGVARALMDALHTWASDDGARTTSLWVVDGNEAACTTYESFGYAPSGVRMPVPRDPSLVEERWTHTL